MPASFTPISSPSALGYPIFLPNVTAISGTGATTLAGQTTIGLTVPRLYEIRVSGVRRFVELLAEPVEGWENSATIIQPADYNASTNRKKFKLLATLAEVGLTGTKSDVGLGNADNTSDLNKPISNATQSALDNKAPTVHTHNSTEVNVTVADGSLYEVFEPVQVDPVAGTLTKSQANTFATAHANGIVKAKAGNVITVATFGFHVFPPGVLPAPGSRVRVSVSTAGGTQTDVAGSGYITELGLVLSATGMFIAIEAPVLAGPQLRSEQEMVSPRRLLGNLLEIDSTPYEIPPESALMAAIAGTPNGSRVVGFNAATNQPEWRDQSAASTEVSPTVIGALDIDFSVGTERFKNIAANTTFTLSNVTEGRRVRIDLTNTSGASVNVTFTGAKTPSDAQLTLAANSLAEFELVRKNGVTRARVVQTGYAVDTVAPVLTHSINAAGDTLTTASTEPMYLDGATPADFNLTNLTPSVTLSGFTLAGDRLSFTHVISRVILSSETPQITIGASNGIRDAAGNQVDAVTGGTVTNGSTGSGVLGSENFEEQDTGGVLGSGTDGYSSPTIIQEVYTGTGATINPDATDWTGKGGARCLKISNTTTGRGEVVFDFGSSYDTLWLKGRFRLNGAYAFNRSLFELRDSSNILRTSLGLNNSGMRPFLNNNGVSTASAFGMANDTDYTFWLKHIRSGALGVYITTGTTRPTVDATNNFVVEAATGSNFGIRRLAIGINIQQNIHFWIDDLVWNSAEII